jgi:7,8-dihydro-6-hydroxymethylpterin-pyrophosphokinase
MGRTRQIKWGPRTIDLDILLYGGCIIEEDGMVIPHPELHKRRFVLVPMNEIASYIVHPLFGISMKGLLDRLRDKSAVELLEYKTKDLRNGFLATKFESS